MSNTNTMLATALLDIYIETDNKLNIQFISCTSGLIKQTSCAKLLNTSLLHLVEEECKTDFKNFAVAKIFKNKNFALQFGKSKQYFLFKKNLHSEIKKRVCFLGTLIPAENSKANIDKLVSDINGIFFLIDNKGLILSCSKEAEKQLALNKPKIENKVKLHELNFTEKPKISTAFKKNYASNDKFEMEALFNVGNKKRILNWKFSAPTNTNNHHYKVILAKDITEIVQNRDILLESENRFKNLAKVLPIPIGCVNKTGEILFINTAATNLFGIKQDTIKTVADYLYYFYPTKAEANAAYSRWLEDINSHKDFIPTRISRIKSANTGEVRDIEVTGAISKDYIYYYYSDITDKIKYEKELISARDYFKKIAQHIPMPFAICDKNLNVIFLNKEFESVTGYNQNDLPTLFHSYKLSIAESEYEIKSQKKFWEQQLELFANNKLTKSFVIERQYICKNGEVKHFEISISSHDDLLYGIFNDITQKKLQENKLKLSEQKFKNLTESTNIPITCTNANLDFIYVNKKFTNTFGLDIDSINIDNAFFKKVIVAANESIEVLMQNFRKLIAEKIDLKETEIPVYEIKILDKNNNIKTYQLNISIHQNLVYYLYIDITDRLLAENKLKASEERFKKISENAPLPICTFDLQMNITYINNRFKNILGYSLKEVSKNNSWPYMVVYNNYIEEKKGRQEWLKAIEDAATGKRKKLSSLERTIKCKDGSKRIFDISFRVEDDLVYAILDDITEKKSNIELLFKSEQRFKALAEKMPIAIATHNFNEEIVFINKYFEESLGYTLEEIPTLLDWYKKTQPNATTRNALYKHWLLTLDEYKKNTTAPIPYIETQLLCKNGKFKTFNFLFSIHENDVFVILVDITERRNAEMELTNSHVQLRELASHLQKVREEERKYISREIHDELGQLVTGLKMDISMCKKTIAKEVPDILPKIDSVLDLTDTIVRTVRRISSELRPGIIDDLGLIPALQWQAKEFEKRSGIACIFKDTTNDFEFDYEIKSNIFRIFQESLTNIMRHANATKVEAFAALENSIFCLTIIDNGKGFSQIAKTKTLGILGMKERTIVINGTFELNSKIGIGTTISIKIPIPKP